MKSESASLNNLDKYEWHTYIGKKKIKLNNRGRVEYISEGKKFGIRPLIRGGGSTVTFEDNLKVDFRITDKEAKSVMSRTKKARTPTNLAGKLEKSKKTRTKPTESENATRKHNFDAVRYQGDGKRLPSPKTAGVDFSRFQWRKIQAPIVTIQKTKQNKQVFEKNALIGMRFDSPARGGIVTDTQGMTSKVTTELYDHIVEGSKLLPSKYSN